METINITLNLDQANLILSALSEMPYKQSAPLIAEITNQAKAQLEAKKPTHTQEIEKAQKAFNQKKTEELAENADLSEN